MTTLTATPIAELNDVTENKSATSQPKSLIDFVEAGQAAINEGDIQSALTHFKTAVKVHPQLPEGHNNLGAIYSSIGQFKLI